MRVRIKRGTPGHNPPAKQASGEGPLVGVVAGVEDGVHQVEGLRLIEDREAQDNARLHALREAARIGIADVDAGRFRSFESPVALSRHLNAIADKVIGGNPATRRR